MPTMTGFDEAVQAAADRIQQYLRDFPEAADTADGIAGWWLRGVPEPIVQAALDDLVRRGVMKREAVTGGRPQYSRATHP
jgi:hypothetical protein